MIRVVTLLSLTALAACSTQPERPAQVSSNAKVSALVSINSDRQCSVIESTGNPELDRKTCDALRACVAKDQNLQRALEDCAANSIAVRQEK